VRVIVGYCELLVVCVCVCVSCCELLVVYVCVTTLQTLLRFLNWIPLGYVFETNLLAELVSKVCELL